MTYCESTQQKLAIQPLSPDEQEHLNDCTVCQARLRAEQSLSGALVEGPTYDDPQPGIWKYYQWHPGYNISPVQS